MNPQGVPLPPDVASQMPNMAQYAQQGQAMLGGGDPTAQGQEQGVDPSAFANDALNQIAEMLGKVAQVILQTRPELGPLVKKMAEAGSMLQGQLTAQDQGDQGNQVPPQPESAEDVPLA